MAARSRQTAQVAIVGGGASGVLAARSLARLGVSNIVVVDPNPGRGLAYGGTNLLHRLNTRATNMSLDEADSGNFLDWLNERQAAGQGWSPNDFAPRPVFGDYLASALQVLLSTGRVGTVEDRAVRLDRAGRDWRLTLAGGGEVLANAVLLATGNAPPAALRFPGRDAVSDLVIDNPWNEAALAAAPDEGEVLAIGTGLTAVDVAVTLLSRPGGPRVRLASRRGLLPRIHDRPHKRMPALSRPFPATARELYRRVRELSEAVGGWDVYKRHVVFLGLKPVVPEIWAGLPLVEKRRFARHLRAWWEVERHRLAPEIAAILQQGRDADRFAVQAGRITGAVRLGPDRAAVTLARQGRTSTVEVSRIVNCTGPDWRIDRPGDPLLASVLALGAAPDAMALGLDVDEDGGVRNREGALVQGLYALGPLTRGAFFEITAVPEIRAKAAQLSVRIEDDLRDRQSSSVPLPPGLAARRQIG